jgi:TIR domain
LHLFVRLLSPHRFRIQSVDRGLSSSRYAIVVLSEQFFKKEWPKRELAGLTTLELQYKARFVLPIWYRISKETVATISPPLADKLAIVSDGSDVDTVAKRLVDIIGAQQKLR